MQLSNTVMKMALFRIKAEALRQEHYWESKGSAQLQDICRGFYQHLGYNAQSYLEEYLSLKGILIKECEYSEQNHNANPTNDL